MNLAAIDTLLAVLLTFILGGRAGQMRGRHKVQAPATTGHPDFERAFRTHMNTVENMVLMLPALWVASLTYGGQLPFWIGLVWVVSRVIYAFGYAQSNVQMRAPGAVIGFLSILALVVLGAIGLVG